MDCTPWVILMRNFLDAFTDFAKSKKAQNPLQLLKMREGKIDDYIATFECLAHQAGIDLDDPSNMRTFVQGLPGPLVKTVIRQDDPQNYFQWREATQRYQHNYLKIQMYKGNYGSPQPPNHSNLGQPQCNVPFGNFYWRCPNQGGQGNRPQHQPARQRLPLQNDDAMDTSAMVRKVNTDKEKEEYHKTGQCFECGKQGHLARVCPTKKNRQSPFNHTSNNCMVKIEEDNKSEVDSQAYYWDPKILATQAMKFLEEDRDTFV